MFVLNGVELIEKDKNSTVSVIQSYVEKFQDQTVFPHVGGVLVLVVWCWTDT